jgi:hypothetical protein
VPLFEHQDAGNPAFGYPTALRQFTTVVVETAAAIAHPGATGCNSVDEAKGINPVLQGSGHGIASSGWVAISRQYSAGYLVFDILNLHVAALASGS